jgi:predicted house-cleaning noncanonical NTP pyrophosphatase (MazG superfamily)
MRKDYNKLVRDRIPEIIERSGRDYEIEIMEDGEYKKKLLEKLVEEAEEARSANKEEFVKELGDVYEVLETIEIVFGIDPEKIKLLREERKKNRGGFEKRIKLIWTKD